MRLVQRSLEGRAFAVQFSEIFKEFGQLIPWLRPTNHILFATNGAHFKREIEVILGAGVVAYQLTDRDPARDFIGGMLHFPHSPENFIDPRNQDAANELTRSGSCFISCIQIRDVKRGSGYGMELVSKSLDTILNTYPSVWGVCDPELTTWYEKLGAKVLSPQHNDDNLHIISWDSNRH